MKKLITICAVSVLAFASAIAEEITYVSKMTGLHCNGCKKSTTLALSKELKGFKSIKIEKAKEEGFYKVTVTTKDVANLTKKDAVTAIGDKASHVKVHTWERKG